MQSFESRSRIPGVYVRISTGDIEAGRRSTPLIAETILDVNLQQLESLENAIEKLATQIAKKAVERRDVKLLMD